MFRFEDSNYLYILFIIPVLIGLYYLSNWHKKRRMAKYGEWNLLKQLMIDYSSYRPDVKFWLVCVALALVIVMLARPQFGSKMDTVKRSGIEAMICMDISNSMMAEDVSPNRLERAKMIVSKLVDNMDNDKVGLVLFAGDAFTQLPMTADYVSAKMFLDGANPSLINLQGTDIKKAINIASGSFSKNDKVGRAIILITDGEDNEGGAIEAAREAQKKGINIYILGIGDASGARIPDGNGGYMTDHSGNTVITRLNEEMCRQIAQSGKGKYIHVDNSNSAQNELNAEISKLAKSEMESTIYSEYDEQFQAFALLVLVLLVIDICVLEKKNPLSKKFKLFSK